MCFVATEGGPPSSSSSSSDESGGTVLELTKTDMPGVTLYKTNDPIDEGPVGADFPSRFPVQFIDQAFNINVLETQGGKELMKKYNSNEVEERECSSSSSSSSRTCSSRDDDDAEAQFGKSLLARASEMFAERQCHDELQSFLDTSVSNPGVQSGPRRMYWVGIEIQPNKSLALHSHPNIEYVYIVEGVMHEWRLVDPNVPKKKIYTTIVGPNLTNVNGNETFQHQQYKEGEMFINTIGDVHQSYTMDEGVKLFAMWGNGNADVPIDQIPHSSEFLNSQSAKAWS